MAVAVDFFPVTGQTLPLISMGGVSVIFTCISLGVIISASRCINVSKISAMSVRVIISGGGTGGHIFPAISIANELKRRVNDINILFVGAKGRREMEKVPNLVILSQGLTLVDYKGVGKMLEIFGFLLKLISSLFKSYWIIKKYKPSVVVGTGGYASGPLLFVASKLSIPALIQEQNSYPGITNKLLSKTVQKICVSYDNMDRFFPKSKLMMLGNPVRQDLLDSEDKKTEAVKHFNLDSSRKTLLVVGGSLGARTINHSIAELVQQFEEKTFNLFGRQVFHMKLMPRICVNLFLMYKPMHLFTIWT